MNIFLKLLKKILKEIDYALGWFLYFLWRIWKKKPYRFAALAMILLLLIQLIFPIVDFKSIATFFERKNENTEIKRATIFSKGLYANENNDFRIEFGDRANKDQQRIRFEAIPVAGKIEEGGFISKNLQKLAREEKKGVEFSLTGAENSDQEGSFAKADKIKTELVEEDGKEIVINPEVFRGIDLRYQTVSGKGLKEDILIKNKENAKDTFVFDMKLDPGVKPIETVSYIKGDQEKEKRKTNDYYFVNEKGKYLFNFERPFAIDSNGTRTNNVVMEITKSSDAGEKISQNSESLELPNTGWSIWDEKAKKMVGNIANAAIKNSEGNDYQIRLFVDPRWLLDSTRAYPITIDPSIAHDTEAEFDAGDALNRVESIAGPKVQIDNPIGGNDGATQLLIHADGTNGSTGFVDRSSRQHPITANGGAQISTAQSKFGGASAYFDGSGDFLTVADSNDFDFGTNNFTVDFWAYNLAGNGGCGVQLANGVFGGIIGNINSGTMYVYLTSSAGSWNIANGASMGAVPGTNWVHYALVRNGSNFYTFRNGVQVSTFSSSAAIYMPAGDLNIAKYYDGSTYYASGYLDEVRISKGIARWTSNFTPPTKYYDFPKNYGVYTSSVIDVSAEAQTIQWTENGVQTGDGETPYSTSSLVGQWNFNETSGTSAADASGNGRTGTLTSFGSTGSQDATVNSGWTSNNRRWGAGALMFDGSDDYVNVASAGVGNFGNGTISAWIKPTLLTGGSWCNTHNGSGSCRVIAFSDDYGYFFGVNSDGALILDLGNGSSWSVINNTVPGIINAGSWKFVTVTVEGTTIKYYVNGALVQTNTVVANNGFKLGSNSRLGIGSAALNPTAYPFSGIMDSVQIYSRVLSAEEIMSDYQSGNVEFQTRSGADVTPDDGSWEAWKPSGAGTETQIASMDSDSANWSWDSTVAASTPVSKADESTLKMEGAGSMKLQLGIPQVDANTVGLWHMEETGGSGAYIKDSSSSGNHGTPTNTTIVDGITGKGRGFNKASAGTNSEYINTGIANSSSSKFSNAFSVEAWVKPTIFDASHNTVVGEEAGFLLAYNPSGTVANYIYAGGSWGGPDGSSCGVILNKWQHLAMTYDGATIKSYLNGVQCGSGTAKTGNMSSSSNVYIGIRNNSLEQPMHGDIDEVKISNTARTADEIAEAYRLGRDHRVSRTISSTNLSSASKMPFYAAGDKLGMCVEASIGNSSFANYEPDANTVALWHLEEDSGSGAYIKDSAKTNHGTPQKSVFSSSGKIGKAKKFDGTDDYISVPDSTDFTFGTGDFTIDFWVNPAVTTGNYEGMMGTYNGNGFIITTSYGTDGHVGWWNVTNDWWDTGISLETNKWQHLAFSRSSGTLSFYKNGIKMGVATSRTGNIDGGDLTIGGWNSGYAYLNGMMDEIRITKGEAKSADQIRQAYENGARLHPVVVDFAAFLDSGNLITGSGDTSFTVNASLKGLVNKGENIFKGDKIIVRENYNGTEYAAQGTVTDVNSSTGAITVTSWDAGSTFPAGGFTVNATVFKWQREWFDLTWPMDGHINAITKISLRSYDQIGGKNFWLDDIEYATNYLTNPSATNNVQSGDNEFFQYRAIINTRNSQITPYLSSVTTTYDNLVAPTGVSATDGTHTDKVVVSWNDVPGATGYKVWNGSSWIDVGYTLSYNNTAAPIAVISGGTATASDGTNASGVDLSLSGASVSPVTISYKVRAYNSNEESSDSASDNGYRAVPAGSLSYQWQVSAGDSDASYSDITGGTTVNYLYTLAPSDGSGRYFRCRVSYPGLVDAYSTANRGFVCALPVVTTQYPTDVALTSVTANGNITSIGKDSVTVRGFKYGVSQADTWDVHANGTFSTGAYTLPVTSLTKNTVYYIRSYATNSCGTSYGSYVAFFTIMDTAPVELKNNMEIKYNVEIK